MLIPKVAEISLFCALQIYVKIFQVQFIKGSRSFEI